MLLQFFFFWLHYSMWDLSSQQRLNPCLLHWKHKSVESQPLDCQGILSPHPLNTFTIHLFYKFYKLYQHTCPWNSRKLMSLAELANSHSDWFSVFSSSFFGAEADEFFLLQFKLCFQIATVWNYASQNTVSSGKSLWNKARHWILTSFRIRSKFLDRTEGACHLPSVAPSHSTSGSDGKESACDARYPGSIPGSGRPSGEEYG